MKLLLILSCVIVIKAGVTKRDILCDGPVVNEVIHTKETLITGLDRPYLLSTDYTTNTVYFSYSVYPNDTAYKSAKIDLKTKEFAEIYGVKAGFAHCVSELGDVYIGADDGVYKYNKFNNTATIYIAEGVAIWTVFFKDVLYYADSADVYTVVDGKASKFEDIEENGILFLTIDNEENMFFYANDTGLFRQKKGSKDAVHYKDTKSMDICGLATDLNGDVYVAAGDGIFVVDKLTNELKIHLKFDDGVFGITFDDKNNIVYSDRFGVYKLRPTRYDECI